MVGAKNGSGGVSVLLELASYYIGAKVLQHLQQADGDRYLFNSISLAIYSYPESQHQKALVIDEVASGCRQSTIDE